VVAPAGQSTSPVSSSGGARGPLDAPTNGGLSFLSGFPAWGDYPRDDYHHGIYDGIMRTTHACLEKITESKPHDLSQADDDDEMHWADDWAGCWE